VEASRLCYIRGKDIQSTGIAQDRDAVPGRYRLFGQ
jgi:hypothetical protein